MGSTLLLCVEVHEDDVASAGLIMYNPHVLDMVYAGANEAEEIGDRHEDWHRQDAQLCVSLLR